MLESLRKLKADPQFWTQVAIGGVLVWLSTKFVLTLPLVLLPMGYAFALMKKAVQGKDELPSWSDMGEHIVNGVFAFMLSMLFLLPAGLLYVLSTVSTFSGSLIGGMISKFLALGFFLLFCAGFSFFLMSLARYAATGKFSASFAVPAVAMQIAKCLNDLVLLVALCAGVATFVTTFAGTLSKLPFSWMIAGAGMFVLWMVSSHATGTLYRNHFLQEENTPATPALELKPRPTLGSAAKDEDEPGLTRIRGNDNGWA